MQVQHVKIHCPWNKYICIVVIILFTCLFFLYNEELQSFSQPQTYLHVNNFTVQKPKLLENRSKNTLGDANHESENLQLNKTRNQYLEDTPGYLVYTPSCQIPDIDPFDESIRPFLKHAKQIKCSDKESLTSVMKVNDNSRVPTYKLRIDPVVLSKYYKNDKLRCCFSIITRYTLSPGQKIDRSADNLYNVSRCKYFEDETILQSDVEFLLVKCFRKDSPDKVIYENMHSVVPIKEEVKRKIHESYDSEEKLSVLLLGIDSMSRLNMHRTMPDTVKLLKDKGWIEMLGHNKVGDNTIPNIMGIFAGYDDKEITKKGICAPLTDKSDDCPLIWKNFSDSGYVTMYAEDRTHIGTFHFEKIGFVKQPTDYYLRPYMVAAEKMLPPPNKEMKRYCLGPQSVTDHVLNYLNTFLDVFKNYPFFAHVWLNNFSHDDHNTPAAMDQRFHHFLSAIADDDVMNRTIAIFFGDHGMRFGKIRETYVGWLENNLPFIYIWLPPWFRATYPQVYRNLVINSHRLTSHFDLHETLKSILGRSYAKPNDSEVSTPTPCKSCVSLFSQVIEDRSCDDVGIKSEFCTCSQYETISTDNLHVRAAALHAVSDINQKLESSKSKVSSEAMCAHLNLTEIMTAKKKISPAKQKFSFDEFFIVLKTVPGEAIFETNIKHLKDGNFETAGFINRINSYGNQSECADDSELKLYCFCVNY